MSPRHRRTQKAGYKYLRNKNRAAWIETLMPYGNQIISQLPTLNWNSFLYTGPIEATYQIFSNNPREVRPVQNITFQGIAKSPKIPYEVFGGAACELWASQFPTPSIRKFVDPTSDIDVMVALPDVSAIHDETGGFLDDPAMILFSSDTGLTELGDQYSRWLFNEVVRVYSPLVTQFDRPLFRLPDISEDSETSLADLAEFYGNLLFTRSVSAGGTMIKIQISTKISTEFSTNVSHLLEFIMLSSGQSNRLSPYQIRGIHTAPPWTLFTQQVKGLTDRSSIILDYWQKNPAKAGKPNRVGSFYKIDNHCGRLLYLAQLQKQVEGKPWPLEGAVPKQYFPLLNTYTIIREVQPLFKLKSLPMCNYHFRDFRQKLFEIFNTYTYVEKGVLTNLHSKPSHNLTMLLYKGGRRRGKTLKKGGGSCTQIQKW
jgi:hypothetical protein